MKQKTKKERCDAESLQFIPGGGFYIGDEYAAHVYRFDARGRLTGVLVPPRAVRPADKDGKPYFTSLEPPATGRRNNQGVEGMARFESDVNLSDEGTATGKQFRSFVGAQAAWGASFSSAWQAMGILGIPRAGRAGFADCTNVVVGAFPAG